MKTDIEKEKIEKLINNGVTFRQIAESFDVPLIRIRRLCKKYHLVSQYNKLKHKYCKCINCSADIKTTISEDKKFCSHSCATTINNKKRKRKRKEKKCKYCDAAISIKYEYCSLTCYYDFITIKNISEGVASAKTIKNYMIKMYGPKCMECGWDKVNPISGKVPIELEHIDGNSDNNHLDNVKLLCPNCHSLTPTYKALNKGKGRHKRMERYREGKSY